MSDENHAAPALDRPRAVRAGEELDAAKLGAWLRGVLPPFAGDLVIEQFPAGHSNLTYFVRAGDQELVLRRPPFGAAVKTGHDMSREYRILSRLKPVFAAVPRAVAYCEDDAVIGAPFYVMERVQGVIMRGPSPRGVDLTPELARGLCDALVDTFVALHGIDVAGAGLADLGKPEGYVERQVSGWAGRYDKARTDDVPEMEQLARWLAENRPPESGAAIVHNDYKFDNLVLDPGDLTHVRAVLDWEMATLGDPLMDLGTTLGYWVDASDSGDVQDWRFGPTGVPGALTRTELVARYEERSGRAIKSPVFYYAFGLFKIAVIAQQIFARFRKGHTQDQRFAMLGFAVPVMAQQALRVVESGKLN